MKRFLRKNAWGVLLLSGMIVATVAWAFDKHDWKKRDKWQNAPGIFKAMEIDAGSYVADIGAREGYLSVRLAKTVGDAGRVFAVDIDKDALKKLKKTAREMGLENIQTVHSKEDDPMLSENTLDAIVIVNSYHEFDEYESMLKHMKAALKKGGRLVLVEPISKRRRDSSRSTQESSHELGMNYARKDLEAAGFEIIKQRDPFVKRKSQNDEMWLLVGRKH